MKYIWNRHSYFPKNHDKPWSDLSILRAWYSHHSSNQLQLSFLSVRNRIGNILLLFSNSGTNIPSQKNKCERPGTIWKCYQVASLLPTLSRRKLSHARWCYESCLGSSIFISHSLLPAEGPSPAMCRYDSLPQLPNSWRHSCYILGAF